MRKYPFTPEEVETYREGDCWVLARELGALTGWSVIGVGTTDHTAGNGYRDFCHLAVRTPHGRILDIEGSHTPQRFLARWEPVMLKEHSLVCREYPCSHRVILFDVKNTSAYWSELLDDISPSFVTSAHYAPLVAQRLLAAYIEEVIDRQRRRFVK